jgi:hypothetical protein
MSESPVQPLSLPEEFVLLSHLDSGEVHGSARAVVGCAAAELGELALRRRLLVRTRKSQVFGLEVHRTHGVRIELLDTAATGLPWADEVLAELSRTAAENGTVSLHRWFRRHHEAFSLHRAALTERGLLRIDGRGLLRKERRLPDRAVREALVTEVRAAAAGRGRRDAHALFLSDLTETVGLNKTLGVSMGLRQRLDRNRGRGPAQSVPEELRDSSAALIALVPDDDSGSRFGRPRV